VTDRRTDGQNYDSKDRTSIARVVKTVLILGYMKVHEILIPVENTDGKMLQIVGCSVLSIFLTRDRASTSTR